MEWAHRLNQSMNYIEEHLTGEIDYEQLGQIIDIAEKYGYRFRICLGNFFWNGYKPVHTGIGAADYNRVA